MKPLFEYLDYREFLKDFFDEQKASKPFFSFRYAASRCGVDPSNLVKVLQGGRHLSKKAIVGIQKLCQLTPKEVEYFQTLLLFSRSRTEAETKKLFEKLLILQGPKTKQVTGDQYEFYSCWYHIAVFTLLDTVSFDGKNISQLSNRLRPSVQTKQIRESLQLLERLKLIQKNEEGYYKSTHSLFTTGDKWKSIAVKNFQKESLKLAENALTTLSPTERDISTLTVSLNSNDLDAIKELTREYRKSVLNVVEKSTEANHVYQLNIQMFPLTYPLKRGKQK